jgi:hypothetical protein
MTYRELLEAYKKGKLSGEQQKKIEEDIERQEAIGDYLYENTRIPELDAVFAEEKDADESGEDDRFAELVRRSIRRAFVRLGVTIVLIAVAVVLFIQFLLPDLVSSFYYDPGEIVAEDTNRLSLDLAAYTELRVPWYRRDNARVVPLGYGNYDIFLYQNVSLNGNFDNLAGTIRKGRLVLYDMNGLKTPANVFGWFQYPGKTEGVSLREYEEQGGTIYMTYSGRERAAEALEGLNEDALYLAYITLDRVTDYEDFMEWIEKHPELSFGWCAVCTNNPGEGTGERFRADNLGFQYGLLSSTNLNWDREAYPNLLLWETKEAWEGDNYEELESERKQEDFMREHFTSLCRYLADQEQFLAMMPGTTPELLTSAADYVEENGIRVYGFAAVLNREEMLALSEEEEIYAITTEPLR